MKILITFICGLFVGVIYLLIAPVAIPMVVILKIYNLGDEFVLDLEKRIEKIKRSKA